MDLLVRKRKTVPAVISDRQFFQGLFERGMISFDEFIGAVGPGTMPASLLLLIGVLPVSDLERQRALGFMTGATIFERNHRFTPMIGQLYGWDADALDSFWIFCAGL
jgi:hypothetical protein